MVVSISAGLALSQVAVGLYLGTPNSFFFVKNLITIQSFFYRMEVNIQEIELIIN